MTHDDLIARLRDTACQGVELAIKNGRYVSPHEAADAIERLEADNARLREVGAGAWVPAEQFVRLRKALENAAEFIGNLEHSKSGRKAYEKARAALQETSHDRD